MRIAFFAAEAATGDFSAILSASFFASFKSSAAGTTLLTSPAVKASAAEGEASHRRDQRFFGGGDLIPHTGWRICREFGDSEGAFQQRHVDFPLGLKEEGDFLADCGNALHVLGQIDDGFSSAIFAPRDHAVHCFPC